MEVHASAEMAPDLPAEKLNAVTCLALASEIHTVKLITNDIAQVNAHREQYKAVLKNIGTTKFPYARIMNPEAIKLIDTSLYPDLYYIVTKILRQEKQVGDNFNTSDHPTKIPKSMIARFVKIRITDYPMLSEEDKTLLRSLGA